MKYLKMSLTLMALIGLACRFSMGETIVSCSDALAPTKDTALCDIVNEARQLKSLRSLLILKDDQLINETYFADYSRDSLDHLRSVTKSVMALLIGIAVDKKFIESIDDPITKYLGTSKGIDARHEQISIVNLLTMTAGFKWDESSATSYNNWVTSKDPVAYVLERNLVQEPGTHFEYNSGVSHLLSVILTEASGQATADFAKTHLFSPLGISNFRWRRINGYYNGGAGLELSPRDMARIGSLMMNKGYFNDRQIVSADWISESMTLQIAENDTQGYGYSWWITKEIAETNALALGYRGQFIIIFPEQRAVVVATSFWRGHKASDQNVNRFLQLVGKRIYPYLKTFAPD